MGRRVVASFTAALAFAALAGCDSGDTDSGLPTLGPPASGPSDSVSVTPGELSASPSTGSSAGGPPDEIAVHLRKVVARAAPERDAAEAFVSYLTVRLTAYHKVAVDLDALGRTAIGPALNAVRADVAGLRSRGQHTVGEVWVDVTKVTVRGSAATLTSCMVNTTVDVDAKGKPLSAPKPFYNVTSTLDLAGGKTWLVKTITFGGDNPCH